MTTIFFYKAQLKGENILENGKEKNIIVEVEPNKDIHDIFFEKMNKILTEEEVNKVKNAIVAGKTTVNITIQSRLN